MGGDVEAHTLSVNQVLVIGLVLLIGVKGIFDLYDLVIMHCFVNSHSFVKSGIHRLQSAIIVVNTVFAKTRDYYAAMYIFTINCDW